MSRVPDEQRIFLQSGQLTRKEFCIPCEIKSKLRYSLKKRI